VSWPLCELQTYVQVRVLANVYVVVVVVSVSLSVCEPASCYLLSLLVFWWLSGCVFVGLFLVSVCCEGHLVWGVKCAGCSICGVGCYVVCVLCVYVVF